MRYNRRDIMEEAGRIMRLAWPIMLTGLNWTLMHLIDVAIVGRMSTVELGALAASRTLTFIAIVMGLAGLSGVLVHVSRADGGGRLSETGDLLRGAVILGLGLGLAAFMTLMLFAEPLLMLVGVSADLQAPGAAVVRAISFGYIGQFALAAASYFLEGISRPRRVMAVNLAMLPVNAVLAWAWVGGHLGLPALGAVGAALATASVSVGGAAAMLILCWRLPRAAERGVHDVSAAAWGRAVAWLPRLATFGFVPGIAAGLELAGFSWLMALSTQLGIVTAGAFQAMFSLHNIVFTLAIGFGSAAGVRVGNAVGAGTPEEAWPRTMIAAGLALLMLGALSASFWLFAVPITAPFSDDRAVTGLAAIMLAMLAPFMLFDGIQYVMGYALRSLGEQVWAGVNSMFAFFVVTGGLGWWLVREGHGATGLVYAAGTGMVLAALLQFARLVVVVRKIGRS